MTTYDGSPTSSPAPDDVDSSIDLPKVRSPEKAASGARPLSDFGRPKRRSNNALSAFLASSAAAPASKRSSSPIVGFPTRRDSRSSSPAPETRAMLEEPNEYKSLILRSFAPHVAVLPSADTEEFLAQKGLPGGLLSLLRPFGENVPGKVTIRDGSGSSKTCEDYSVHFTKLRDGIESPRMKEKDIEPDIQNIGSYLDQQNPQTAARLRTGGDVGLIEETLQKRLLYTDLLGHEQSDRRGTISGPASTAPSAPDSSAFHLLYLWRILSGMPAVPHETFAHPVACVIVVTSRSQDPIEELRQLNASTRTGADKLPAWMNNDYLRYFVLLHDEEHDDASRSQSLFEQMKRHFGLHCHLLRMRSTQCVPSDDGCVTLPICEWQSASEELSEIGWRETLDELDSETGPYVFDSDAGAVKTLVRELVTQSVVPQMERLSTMWNDQIVSKRRGLSGRFFSLSKKWTSPFGGAGTRRFSAFGTSSDSTSGASTPTSSNSNYDAALGTYAPDTPEALMRKLADYAFMLRDFKLAHATYDLLRSDYANDKAWPWAAGAAEMTALSTLLLNPPAGAASARPRNAESLDTLVESSVYNYLVRATPALPYAALRSLAVSSQLQHLRSALAPPASAGALADSAARWAAKLLELRLVGPVGAAATSEHVARTFAAVRGAGSQGWGSRWRKALLWSVAGARAWLAVDQPALADGCLAEAVRLAGLSGAAVGPRGGTLVAFRGMRGAMDAARDAIHARAGLALADEAAGIDADEEEDVVDEIVAGGPSRARRLSADPSLGPGGGAEADPPRGSFSSELKPPGLALDLSNEKPDIRKHRRSMSRIAVPTSAAPLAEAGGGAEGED